MNDIQKQELQTFQKAWGTLEQVKSMTLEQYTNANTTNDSFMYMIEWGTKSLGSISGSYAIKAGIYAKQSETKEIGIQYLQDEKYLWYKSLGDTAEDAFKEAKSRIISIIDAVKNGNLEEIDNVYTLWRGYKYKIAFLYQQIMGKEIIILPIFNWDHLSEKLENTNNNKSMLDLYDMAIKKHNIKTIDDAFSFADEIYGRQNYIISEEITSNEYKSPVTNLPKEQQSSLKDLPLEEKIEILKKLPVDEQVELFQGLGRDNMIKIIGEFQERIISRIVWPCRIGALFILLLGFYFIFHEYSSESNELLWFWILWIPSCVLVFNLDTILMLTCSQIKTIYNKNNND